MLSILERIAKLIVERRLWVQLGIIVITLLSASAISDLRFELTPEALVADLPEAVEHREEMEAAFGPRERRLVVLLESDDVLSAEALSYQHGVAGWLATRRWVRRVDGITVTPLPHRMPAEPPPTLDDLEAEDSAPAMPDGELGEALAAVATSDPVRFPHGMASILDAVDGRPPSLGPLVLGDSVDPTEARLVREVAAARGLFTRRVIGRSGRSAIVTALLSASSDQEARHAAETLALHLERSAPPAGLRAIPAGLPQLQARLVEALETDWALLLSLACLGSIAMLAMGFRSVGGIVLPMAAVGITLAIVTGAMARLGTPIDLLTNVIPPLIITIGLGDAVHLLSRYRDERRNGQAPLPAAKRTLSAMATACFLTSVTTAVGFGSLVVSETAVLRRFGALAAGAVLVAYLVTILFLPSALPAFPGERAARRFRARARFLDGIVFRVSRLAMRRPVPVLVVSSALFVAFVGMGALVRVDGALLDEFDGSSDVRETVSLLEAEHEGVRQLFVVARPREGQDGQDREALEDQTEDLANLSLPVLSELDTLASALREEPGVLSVVGPGDVLREAFIDLTADEASASAALTSEPRVRGLAALCRSVPDAKVPLDRYATADGTMARLEVRLRDRGVRDINAFIDRIEARLVDANSFEGFVSGEAHRASRGLDRVVSDLLWSLALAVLIIFALIGLLFRSPRLALVSIPPNVFPLAAVVAWMWLRGIPLHAATVIVFGVSIGLAVDGTIHILTRYREEHRGRRSLRDAIHIAMNGSGRAVMLSSAAVLLGFAALSVSGFVPIRLFGELSVVAVVSALFAELTILPALLVISWRG